MINVSIREVLVQPVEVEVEATAEIVEVIYADPLVLPHVKDIHLEVDDLVLLYHIEEIAGAIAQSEFDVVVGRDKADQGVEAAVWTEIGIAEGGQRGEEGDQGLQRALLLLVD